MRVAWRSGWIQCDTTDALVMQFQVQLWPALLASAALGITVIVDTRFQQSLGFGFLAPESRGRTFEATRQGWAEPYNASPLLVSNLEDAHEFAHGVRGNQLSDARTTVDSPFEGEKLGWSAFCKTPGPRGSLGPGATRQTRLKRRRRRYRGNRIG